MFAACNAGDAPRWRECERDCVAALECIAFSLPSASRRELIERFGPLDPRAAPPPTPPPAPPPEPRAVPFKPQSSFVGRNFDADAVARHRHHVEKFQFRAASDRALPKPWEDWGLARDELPSLSGFQRATHKRLAAVTQAAATCRYRGMSRKHLRGVFDALPTGMTRGVDFGAWCDKLEADPPPSIVGDVSRLDGFPPDPKPDNERIV